ncbi:hypothetical protein [Citrobacter rodentium]|uniref:Uncharacterized protein n=1 Tax=Citrobacter rodentium TaxID=67825 RepID=A0A482PPL4_CITRO|nr:hypothetical protein [Citrobacter rodentium]KIQ51867.1 hypothetical protein TA05_07840 [Citrobacter rodentium]QBY30567.1 hypothetical protein E2R62_18190 [Citrobacter rodentium]UHO32062.1 hypothetical protein K7R23_04985 [Citrobacter rodentium NBRC 105723 = DSM 16636]HAT8011384.1 hypothetical protein [Citrobacter rodentium NBRC 105723 = DSM 16636]HAT8016199.1 hypothetical protein [Citrobacter rodentium]
MFIPAFQLCLYRRATPKKLEFADVSLNYRRFLPFLLYLSHSIPRWLRQVKNIRSSDCQRQYGIFATSPAAIGHESDTLPHKKAHFCCRED